jgi:hypothetical protein
MIAAEAIAIGLGGVAGAGAGATAAYLVARTRGDLVVTDPTANLTSPIEASIDREDEVGAAAHEWAKAHGMPEAEHLIANKLRLGLQLRDQPGRSRDRRWRR